MKLKNGLIKIKKKDEAANSMFRKWFAKSDSETRKQMLNK